MVLNKTTEVSTQSAPEFCHEFPVLEHMIITWVALPVNKMNAATAEFRSVCLHKKLLRYAVIGLET